MEHKDYSLGIFTVRKFKRHLIFPPKQQVQDFNHDRLWASKQTLQKINKTLVSGFTFNC